jgi:hypothetical protein
MGDFLFSRRFWRWIILLFFLSIRFLGIRVLGWP